MKKLATFFLCVLGFISLQAQAVLLSSTAAPDVAADAEIIVPTNNFTLAEIDLPALRTELVNVPQEFSVAIDKSTTQVSLPMPNGTLQRFAVVESSVLHPSDQEQFPKLRSYRLLGVDDSGIRGRMAVTPNGVTAALKGTEGDIFVEPYASGQNRYHAAYYAHDVTVAGMELPPLQCGFEPNLDDELQYELANDYHPGSTADEKSETANIREYIMALTCTGEYGQAKGGTVESVVASFVEAMTIANTTYEYEVGVRVTLIQNIENLVFLNPGTDPFVNANNGGGLLSQVQGAIIVGGFTAAAYDMGHVFTRGCTDVGGVVGGQVCTPGKDRGVTCHFSNSIPFVIRAVFTHEVAHQFATAHSWANCPGNMGQLASDAAFEPGSGSTIMSYAGACGDQNILGNNDDYYHGFSIQQFTFFSREGTAAACATVIPTENHEPKLTLPYEDGFFIPVDTYFELNASATDEDGDELTYCWEQVDLGPTAPLGMPVGNTPLFRSFPPREASNRTFPRVADILSNNSTVFEVLPSYTRDLTFRCTVRDNSPVIGATIWEDVAFRSTVSAGPFRVLSPNTSDVTWHGGEYREVTWDVANTDNHLVDCHTVNIRLSTDGGVTYPITLLADAPNNGSAFVTVPEVTGSAMRIRVEAAENIFFDISNQNFRIDPPTEPTYTMEHGPLYQELCLPASTSVDFTTGSVLDYADPISLSIAGDLPAGVIATFTDSDIMPGESTQLNLDMSNLQDFTGILVISVAVDAPGLETTFRNMSFQVYDNDYSDLILTQPVDGLGNVNLGTDFVWTPSVVADTYDWQLSDDPTFATLIEEQTGIESTTTAPATQLPPNTLYYWRVRGNNVCGSSEWRTPNVFHTVNILCSEEGSNDTPITIPGTGPLPTISSDLFVGVDGIITDMNLPSIRVAYQPISNFYVTLTSPAGTEVRLFDEDYCFGTDLVAIGFDDEAPDDIPCPPTSAQLFKPAEPLSAFDGENSQGIWTLTVHITETGFGAPGQVGDWKIEFCADGTPVTPNLMTNDTLFVPPLMGNTITPAELMVSDGEQSAEAMVYTITSLPAHGKLYKAGQELVQGSTFTQNTVDAYNLTYVNLDGDVVHDGFTFVVENGTGGFLPTNRFNIKIDEDATVGTQEIPSGPAFELFPNPATNQTTVQLAEATADPLPLQVMTIEGKQLMNLQLPAGTIQHTLSIQQLPAGVYVLRLGGRTVRLVKE